MAVFRMLDGSGALLYEKNMGLLSTFQSDGAAWSTDGEQLSWPLDSLRGEAILMDARTLEITQRLFWPDIVTALGSGGWVAIAGEKGVVLTQAAVAAAVMEIGQPANDIRNLKGSGSGV